MVAGFCGGATEMGHSEVAPNGRHHVGWGHQISFIGARYLQKKAERKERIMNAWSLFEHTLPQNVKDYMLHAHDYYTWADMEV